MIGGVDNVEKQFAYGSHSALLHNILVVFKHIL